MFSNRLLIVALAAACIVAAGAGGYIASRQNATTPVSVSAAPAPVTSTPAAPVASTDRPVQETEGVVGDAAPRTTTTPTPSSTASSVPTASTKRSEAPARTTAARSAKAAAPIASRPAPPPLAQTWPTSAATQPVAQPTSTSASSSSDTATTQGRSEDRATAEAPHAQEPPAKTYEELVVSADSVIGLQTEAAISSEHARVEDTVQARVSRDVRVGDKVAIPAGTRAIGSVVQVEPGGKFKERARLGIRFHTLVLADGTRVPISTDTIYREGDAPTSAQKIGGGAVIGTILGAIVGGGKGAVIGGAAGAGAGTAATMAGDRSNATFPAGSPMTVRILSPVTVTVEQK
jgi:hypothetical protein